MKNIFFYSIVFILILGCQKENPQLLIKLDTLDWLPEREDVIPGAILVPENHNDPDSNKIQITYVVLKAKDTTSSAYPMIFFAGGPGGSALSPGLVNFILEHPFTEERDVILFDQRGIGYSSPLPDMSSDVFNILAKDANEEEELELMTAMMYDYKNKCVEQDISPQFYNTMQNAKDVGMLFKHLGYGKYNLFGGSYGTRLARVVQDVFPEYVHSSILDSPSPLTGDFLALRLKNYSMALQRIIDYCKNNPDCESKYPELKADYYKAISILKKKPIKVTMNDSLDVFVNAQDGIYLLRRLLYQNNSREKAPELIKAFIKGNETPIKEILEFEYKIIGMVNMSMLLSVEKYEKFNPANTALKIEENYNKLPLIPVKMGFFDSFYQAGRHWHTGNLPLNERTFMDSDLPTLIYVNRYDPVTPPENGNIFKENLNNGTLLILDEGGHTSGNPKCKDQVPIDFMNNANKELDLSCLNLYKE